MENEDPIRFLIGPRLYLRKLEEGDLERALRWVNDPGTWHFLGRVYPMNMADERVWFERLTHKDPPTDFVFAMVLHDTNEVIGITGLHAINWVNRHATTGSLIGTEQHRNRGYGKEAKRLILGYAFDTLNLHRVNSYTLSFNERSAGHLESVGYTLEGRRREAWFRDGAWHDELVFGILAEDWRTSERS